MVAGFEQIRDQDITLVSDDALNIIIKFFFCFNAQTFNLLKNGGAELELLDRFLVTLKEFDGIPAQIFRVTGTL